MKETTCQRCEQAREAGIKATWCVDCKESLGIKKVDDTPLKFHASNLIQCPCCKHMINVTLTEVE